MCWWLEIYLKKILFCIPMTWLQSSTNCALNTDFFRNGACNSAPGTVQWAQQAARQPSKEGNSSTSRSCPMYYYYIYIIFKYKHASYTYTLYIIHIWIYIYIYIDIHDVYIYIYTRIFIFCMSRNYLLCIIYIYTPITVIYHSSGSLFWFQAACYFPDPIPAASLELSVNIQWFGW